MPSLGGFEWLLLMVVFLGLPVVGATVGYRIGKRQGREQVARWQNGQPLER